MRVPLEWLNEYVKVGTDDEAIAHRLTMGGSEVEGIEAPEKVCEQAIKKQCEPDIARAAADLGNVLNVYVTPNRGDCQSLVGIAREAAALHDLDLHVPAPAPSSDDGETSRQTSVTIEDFDLCPRYAARLVKGVKIGPSPRWMQARLAAAGQRPINNVVDVTNYVMLEFGQPLHAFDFDRLAGAKIVVRRALPGEKLTTLDEVERELSPEMLVIADVEKAVALAGIMGGASSEVTDNTTSILIESAHFNALSVRRTSRALGLKTEASYRFERVVDPDGVRRAADRACELLARIGQPQAVEGVVDVYPLPAAEREIPLRVRRANALLGMDIASHIAADCLRALGFEVQTEPHGDTDTLNVRVPTFRSDVTQEEDIIEEVGRIYGYENIPETLPFANTTQGGDSPLGEFLMQVRRSLVRCGLQEVVTHSLGAPSFFDSPEDAAMRIAIRNALSAELSGLRRSLLPTMLDVAHHNFTKGGQRDMALFEVGRVWQSAGADKEPEEYLAVAGLLTGVMAEQGWQHDVKPYPCDFSTAKGVVERLFHDLRLSGVGFQPLGAQARNLPQLHPGRSAYITLSGEIVGVIAEGHPRLTSKIGLRDRVYLFEISLEALRSSISTEERGYRPFSDKPAVSRDIAPRVAEDVPFSLIEQAVHAAGVENMESFRLTDVYLGQPLPEGIKSLTLSFVFRAPNRTLTEAEINEAMERLRAELASRCNASFP